MQDDTGLERSDSSPDPQGKPICPDLEQIHPSAEQVPAASTSDGTSCLDNDGPVSTTSETSSYPVEREAAIRLVEDDRSSTKHERSEPGSTNVIEILGECSAMQLELQENWTSSKELEERAKTIYKGLVDFEQKCSGVTDDPLTELQAGIINEQRIVEQCNELMIFSQRLVREYYKFMIITQHPLANDYTRGFPSKQEIPERLQKVGLHHFLSLLKRRLPTSQNHLDDFINFIYDTMSLLYEKVPSLTYMWFEDLGDLASYRLKKRGLNPVSSKVVAKWYIMASNQYPHEGRLYHKSGAVESLGLRQLFLYVKTLTCVNPFSKARESLSALCDSVIQQEATLLTCDQLDAKLITSIARLIARQPLGEWTMMASNVSQILRNTSNERDVSGAYLAYIIFANVLGYNDSSNMLASSYKALLELEAIRQARVSPDIGEPQMQFPDFLSAERFTIPEPPLSFMIHCCEAIFGCAADQTSSEGFAAFAYVTLVILHSLVMHMERLATLGVPDHRVSRLNILPGFPWPKIANFLNSLGANSLKQNHILELAQQDVLRASSDVRPLPEDHLIYGSSWAKNYFSPGWSVGQPESDGKLFGPSAVILSRVERMQRIGHRIAFRQSYLKVDQNQIFSAIEPVAGGAPL